MKFFGKEVPPRATPEKKEDGIRPEEPIFRPKPEASLDIQSLVEKAKAGEPLAMVEELDRFYDAWTQYAQDRNVFSGEVVRNFAQSRREAIQLAREGNYEGLEAKLEELSSERAAAIEAAAEENLKRLEERQEATPKENKEALSEAVEQVEQLRHVQEPSPEQVRDRQAEREAKAQAFAEKYDIVGERQALLVAEENYANAIRQRNESFFKLKLRDDAATKGQREILESAIQNWRAALAKAGERAEKEGSKQDKISANFISARDSMMRMEQVRQRAVAEGLDARSKTTIGKFDSWANKLNSKLFAGAAAAGKGFGSASEKVGSALGGWAIGKFVDKDADPDKYKRASRIIGSAAIMTAILAPFGAVTAGAAGMTFVWRTARGLLGWGAGTAAGAGAGKIYDLQHGSEGERLKEHEISQADLLKVLKSGRVHVLDQKLLAELYKKGSNTEFTKSEQKHAERKMRAEMAAAALVAGASSYGLSHFPPVHEALTNHPLSPVHPLAHAPSVEHSPVAPHAVYGPGPVTPEEAAAPAVHIETVSVHGQVNDADKLFGRFVDNVKTQFPDAHTAPPALRALREQYHQVNGMHQEDTLTKFLHLQNGGSVVVHPGDTLSYEDGKVIFQGHTLIDEHGAVHNLREGGQVDIKEPTEPPVAPEHPTASHPSAEHPVQAAPAAAPQTPPPAPIPPEHVSAAPETAAAEQATPPMEHSVPPTEHTAPPPIEHVTAPEAQPVPAPEHVVQALPVEHAPSNDNTPTVTHEAPTPSVEHAPTSESAAEAPVAHVPASIEKLTHSPLWNMARTRDAYELFDTPVPVSATDAVAFRQNLFDLMKASGVGPDQHEELDQYLSRAEAAIAKGNVVQPVIVETPDQQLLIAHGGDLRARMVLTREFLREYQSDHPDTSVNVVVENVPGAPSKAFIVTTETLTASKEDGIYYPTFEEAHMGDHHKAVLPAVTPDMKVIF